MTGTVGDRDGDLARQREALRQDRYALGEILRDRHTCEATGAPLNAEDAVAMLVSVGPGISRLAVVSGTHWDSGNGALSAADPDVDPDVLDGRTLFTNEESNTRHVIRPRSPGRAAHGVDPVVQPRPQEPGATGLAPRI
jgi:hypothetical protein